MKLFFHYKVPEQMTLQTSSIALQLNDTNGITINRAVTNNQTLNSIGNITAEASLNVWGDLLFQHSSAIYENLNGSDYDLVLRNGDTDRSISFIVGAIGSTPEISVNEANVNLLGHLDFTHSGSVTSHNLPKLNTARKQLYSEQTLPSFCCSGRSEAIAVCTLEQQWGVPQS